MAEIAVALAKSKAEGLVGMVFDKALGELSLLSGVRGEIQYTVDEMEIMSAFLQEAEKQQSTNEAARAWVKQVKQLAYVFEDCIDEFSLHLGRPSSNSSNCFTVLRRIVRSLSPPSLKTRHQIANQIRSIRTKVEEVSSRRSRYGINDLSEVSTFDYDASSKYNDQYIKELKQEAIEGPGDKFIKCLLHMNKPQFTFIMASDTTGNGLAVLDKAYRRFDVSRDFQCRAQIKGDHSYEINELLRSVICQCFSSSQAQGTEVGGQVVTRQPSPDELLHMTQEQLTVTLQGFLEDKSYLILFFDANWRLEMDAFRKFEAILAKNDRWSRLIAHTSKDCALWFSYRYDAAVVHDIEGLSPEQSFNWFCKLVFNNTKHACPPKLDDLCRVIIEKCVQTPNDLVVAAKILASTTKTRREWEKLVASLDSEFDSNENMKILSFNSLPYDMKRCFLYLSRFPSDYVIECKRIQMLWIAEWLITDHRNMTARKTAEVYIRRFALRWLILPLDVTSFSTIKSFKIPDSVCQMIVRRSNEENLVSQLPDDSDNMWIPQEVVRRLSVYGKHIPRSLSLSHVRSLALIGDGSPSLISKEARFLRVLDLEGCTALDNSHLEVICQLLHLKYLSIRSTAVSVLPKSIGNLRSLENLDARGCKLRKLPTQILKLRHLSLLLLGDLGISCGPRLRRGIGKLRNLKQLTGVPFGDGKDLLTELRKLTQLRKLGVSGIRKENWQDFCRCLQEIGGSLSSLSLDGDLKSVDFSLMPLQMLRCLKLHTPMPADWVPSEMNLVKFLLHRTELGGGAMRTLGTLPSLQNLILKQDAFKGEILCFRACEFETLRTLHIYVQSSLKNLMFENKTMPFLGSLSMTWCDANTPLQGISGICHLRILNCISLYNPNETDMERVKMAVTENPNHPGLAMNNSFISSEERIMKPWSWV